MIDWKTEWPQIQAAAVAYHVDAYFIGAIRHQENGENGKQFGVLSESAPTYAEQLKLCCETVAHRLAAFDGEITVIALKITKDKMVAIYTDDFINKFASVWAPRKVANDPTGLNANWPGGVRSWYARLMDEG